MIDVADVRGDLPVRRSELGDGRAVGRFEPDLGGDAPTPTRLGQPSEVPP